MKTTTTLLATVLIASQTIGLAQKAGTEQPKLYEPYAPKPSHAIPAGWELKILQGSKVENKTTLKNQKEIKITVPAYELVPITSGKQEMNPETTLLKDPGFKPNLANNQTDTLGAVLTQYSEITESLQTKLQNIIGELETNIGTTSSTTSNATTKPSKQKNEEKKPNSTSR